MRNEFCPKCGRSDYVSTTLGSRCRVCDEPEAKPSADAARDAAARENYKRLVPYLDDEQREKFIESGRNTTFKAFVEGWEAAMEFMRKAGK